MAATQQRISRLLVACLMGTGLLTFFLPIVTTDTAVHGRTEWSPLDLLVSRADLWRPAPAPFQVHAVLYQIASIYMLMMLAVVVLILRSPRTPLMLIGIVGSGTSVSLFRNGPRSFGWLFYGGVRYSRIWDGDNFVTGLLFGAQGLRLTLGYVVLLCVMPLLAFAVMKHRPDSPSSPPTAGDDCAAGWALKPR